MRRNQSVQQNLLRHADPTESPNCPRFPLPIETSYRGFPSWLAMASHRKPTKTYSVTGGAPNYGRCHGWEFVLQFEQPQSQSLPPATEKCDATGRCFSDSERTARGGQSHAARSTESTDFGRWDPGTGWSRFISFLGVSYEKMFMFILESLSLNRDHRTKVLIHHTDVWFRCIVSKTHELDLIVMDCLLAVILEISHIWANIPQMD